SRARQTSEQEAMMRHRSLGPVSVLTALAATAVLSATLVAGQAAKPAASTAAAAGRPAALRTAWGDPDLEGRWTNTTTTPWSDPASWRANRGRRRQNAPNGKPRPGATTRHGRATPARTTSSGRSPARPPLKRR